MAIDHETPPEPVLEWLTISGFAEIAKWGASLRLPHSCLPMSYHPAAKRLGYASPLPDPLRQGRERSAARLGIPHQGASS